MHPPLSRPEQRRAWEKERWVWGPPSLGTLPPLTDFAHLHSQLSTEAPATHDMPGVVSAGQLASALERYPDPRSVLGPLYQGDGPFM